VQQAEVLHAAYQKAGADSTLHVVKGAGHGQGFQAPEVGQKAEAFFTKHLKK
jgi:pimeloyl-ACP methyl ester carboxylesterase